VDSLAADPGIVAGHFAPSKPEARFVYQLVGSLQHALLETLQHQLQPVCSFSKLQSSACSMIDGKLEQWVQGELCSKLADKRGFKLALHLDNALQEMLAAATSPGSTAAAAAAVAGAAAGADGAASSAAAAALGPLGLAATCADAMAKRLLGCINVSHLRERVELFQQSSCMSAAELLQRVMSPLLVPQLLSATMGTAAMMAALLHDFVLPRVVACPLQPWRKWSGLQDIRWCNCLQE
jgi:hypothetical protein